MSNMEDESTTSACVLKLLNTYAILLNKKKAKSEKFQSNTT